MPIEPTPPTGHAALTWTRPQRRRERGWMRPHYIWLDGELASVADAPEELFAAASQPRVFEGVRCYATRRGPAIFRLQEYLERFLYTIRAMGVADFGYDAAALRRAIYQTVQANGHVDCYIRPAMVIQGPMGRNLELYRPVIGITTVRWDDAPLAETRRRGLDVTAHAGDQGLLLVTADEKAVYTADHLLLVQDNVLHVSPGASILCGLTRDTVLTLAQDAGFAVVGDALDRSHLKQADEVIVCDTVIEVAAVRSIDGQLVGGGQPGALAQRLGRLYADTVRGRNQYAARWLETMDLVTVI